jgi:nucleoside-diphosphate-sugar epimerase
LSTFRILVTGGSGFIGTHFVGLLLNKNEEILNVDIQKPKVASHNSLWKQCDIKDFNQLFKIFSEFSPTHVLHLAAKANLSGTTISHFPDNTIGTQNVVNCIKKLTSIKRFIHTSTQYVVYPGIYPKSDVYYQPYTAYGESKAVSEHIVRATKLGNCVWTIVRPTNIWGPWHPAFPRELWRFLSKRYYFHPGFRPIRKHYGYIGNTVDQIYKLLCIASDDVVNHKVFYVTDPPIDNAVWMNAFSEALSGKSVRRVPKSLWRIIGLFGSLVKAMGGSSPVDLDRYFRLTVQESLPYKKTLDITGPPIFSLDDGVRECISWIQSYYPDLIYRKN